MVNLDRLNDDSTLILSCSTDPDLDFRRNFNNVFVTIPWVSGTVVVTGSSTPYTTQVFLRPSGSGGGTEQIIIYRGENPPGTYVYSEGSPPDGASNITIIGYR